MLAAKIGICKTLEHFELVGFETPGGLAENPPRVSLNIGKQNVRISTGKSMIPEASGADGQRSVAELEPNVHLSMGYEINIFR